MNGAPEKTKPWQFSIVDTLVAISLAALSFSLVPLGCPEVAVICGVSSMITVITRMQKGTYIDGFYYGLRIFVGLMLALCILTTLKQLGQM